MPTGIEIYNSSGILMASAEMLTHYCRKTGTGTTVSNTAGGEAASMATIPIPAGFTKPIIAVSCGVTMSFAGIFSGNAYYWCSGAIGTGFTYYIFDTSDALASAGFGMEIYNGSGQITFSSNAAYPMLILGINMGTTEYTGKTIAAGLPAWSSFEFIGPLTCWDTGSAIPWSDPETSGACGDLRYNHRVTVRGAFIDNGGDRINPSSLEYEFVQVSAGDSTNYTYPAAGNDHPQVLFAVDVTGIPIGQTFF
jgi:hypothetical protein